MNAFDLYEAIGEVSEGYLAHSERRVTKRSRRLLTVCLALGLLIAAMTATAFASPSLRTWLFGVKNLRTVRMGERISVIVGDARFERNSFLSVIPEAELRKDPPEKLETLYVPRVLAEDWIPGDPDEEDDGCPELFRRVVSSRQGNQLETRLVFFEPGAVTEQGSRVRAIYHQYAAHLLQSGEPLLLLELPPDDSYTVSDRTVAERGVCEICIPAWSTETRKAEAQYWYFWSDGSYVFAAGFNRAPEAALLERVISDLMPVGSLYPYIRVEDRNPPLPPLTRNLLPAWVPEGFVLQEDSELCAFKDGFAGFFWFGPEDVTGRRGYFRLNLSTDPEALANEQMFWAAEAFPEYRDYTRTECTVRGRPAVLYESRLAVELVWQEADGVTVQLHSEYERRLTTAQLLQIAESLTDAPIPSYEGETP